MAATARMGTGSVVDIEASVRTDNGSAEVRGQLDLLRPRDPAFDLRVSARRLDAARRRDVSAIADGEIHVGGRYSRPILSGNLRVLQGELNLDEIWRQYRIVRLDTSLFSLFDTTTVRYRPPPQSPFLDNLVVANTTIVMDRNMWLRSSELNVEVTGSLEVNVDRAAEELDLRLFGALEALRGTYQLQVLERVPARRFEIRSGTIEFVGTPGIDPNLDIDAGYRVRRVQGEPIDVVASVTGTLQAPRVRLSSDTDPPVSDADLTSYLLFGRSQLELTQAEADVVSSSVTAGGTLTRSIVGFALPAAYGLASSGLQSLAATLGIPLDYLALTAPDYGDFRYVADPRNFLRDAQLEVGVYAYRNVFVVGSFPADLSALYQTFQAFDTNQLRLWGARVEWRFQPTWTTELYLEDRYARLPSFGLQEIDDRKVWGFSLVREWGY
jgi:hypothetical protein